MQGSDLDELYDWSGKFLTRFRKIEGLQDVASNLFNNSPTVTLDIDRDKLPQLGLTVGQVQEALTSSFSTRQVSTIYGTTAQYQVILEVAPEFQNDPAALSKIYVRSSPGQVGAARRGGARHAQESGAHRQSLRANCPR